MSILNYLFVTIAVFVLINIYFLIARKYNILDIPNNRSSHMSATIRGGGIVFPFVMIVYWLFKGNLPLELILGLIILAIISFIDDLISLSSKTRLVIQIVASLLLLFSINTGVYWTYYLWIIPVVLVFINGYNFMDGINGITGLYSFIVLSTLLFINLFTPFVNSDIILVLIITVGVFLFYNMRSKAVCFAGDVGSISIAFVIIYLLILLLYTTKQISFVGIIMVYAIDILVTIGQRIILKQNIFKPHRFHLYQFLANEGGWSHIKVSVLYASIQLLINSLIVYLQYREFPVVIINMVFLILTSTFIVVYFLIKKRYMPYMRG